MKITKKLRKSKGFTLVELLIVIIIIGILAGMMMLAAGSATDKAEATKIISNMRNIKAAAVMFYADKNKWAEDIKSLDIYIDQIPEGYNLIEEGLTVKAVSIDENVVKKLDDMAPNSAISVDVTGKSATMPIK